MKKFLTSVGLALALLGSAILNQAQAQPSQFVVPAYAYQATSFVGQFTDISSDPNTVKLGLDLASDIELKQYFYKATSESDMTCKSEKITTVAATNPTTYPCFPLGFTFYLSGTKPVKYFLVNAMGGLAFSETPSRPVFNPLNPTSGVSSTNVFNAAPYCQATPGSTSAPAVAPAGMVKRIGNTTPAMYLISGTEGNHVLTVQYDYAVNGDEWIFQYKFYEATGTIDFIVKEFKTANLISTNTKSYYAMSLGYVESPLQGYATATAVLESTDKVIDILGQNYLYIPALVNTSQHKYFTGSDTDWGTLKANPGTTVSTGQIPIKLGAEPEEGRTIRLALPACDAPIAPLPESAYNLSNVNEKLSKLSSTNSTFSAIIKYATTDYYEAVDNGTIVAVLSNSPEPDYTLADGTVYSKDDKFPASNGFTPTVLCNRYPRSTVNGTAKTVAWQDGNGTSTQANYPITLTVDGITEGVTRYIHLHRMVYNCAGAPKYSPVCHTIVLTLPIDKPQKLELAGLPTVNSVQVKAKSADGDKVIVIKSSSLTTKPSGVLKVGDKIGDNAEVVALFEGEQTFTANLKADEKCYFLAFTARTSNPDNYTYSLDKLWVSTRAAYNGLPGFINLGLEAGVNANQDDDYNALPFGWTRAINVPAAQRGNSFRLGKAGNDPYLPVALWAINPNSSTQQHDIITPPIKLDKNKMLVTYHVQWYKASDGGAAVTAPDASDKFLIQYDFGDNNWITLGNFTGGGLPANDKYGFYPFEKNLELDESKIGQYIRFRYTIQPKSRTSQNDPPIYHSLFYLDIKELKSCLPPENIRQIVPQTTTTQIGLQWVDGNPTDKAASHYIVSYKRADADGDWVETTVTNPNVYDKPTTKLTGLRNTTSYLVKVQAVCGTEESYISDTARLSTAWIFPYDEPMAKRDTMAKIQGMFTPVTQYSPLPTIRQSLTITTRDGGVTTAYGALGSTLTYLDLTDPENKELAKGFNHNYTFNYQNGVKTMDEIYGQERVQVKSVGVKQTAKNAWLITPVIYTANLTEGEPVVVRFKAKSASKTGTTGKLVAGSVGTAFNTTKLQVLVSNTGNFTTNDVKYTVNVGTETIDDKEYEIELESPVTGTVQIAFYVNNPKADEESTGSNFMTFEIYDVKYEYKNEVAVCPPLEGLERTFLTPTGATFEWAPSDSAKYYDFAYGPADEDGYAHTVKLTEAKYVITGLDEQTTYKVMVTGYCDEEGENAAPDPLTAEFTTPEGCHTPTAFRVRDVEPYGATFISTQTQSILMEREVKVVSSSGESFSKVFKQPKDTLVQSDGLYDNTSYVAQTRAICRFGEASRDTSAWSAAVTFATPVDPASLPDTFNITLLVEPEGAGTVTGDGKYIEEDEIEMIATANLGYRFVEWQNINGISVGKNPVRKVIAKADGNSDIKTHDSTFTAVFQKIYEITVAASPTAGGTVTGAGTYDAGTEVTLTATPKTNYVFTGWQKDGQQVSTNPTYKFTPTADAAFTALFRLKQYFELNVTVTPDDELGSVTANVQPNDDDLYIEGSTVTLTATPANAYCKFVSWQDADDNNKVLSTNPSYTVTMNANKNIQAVFAKIRYTVTLVSNPNTDYGTINGTSGATSTGGTFDAGTTRKLEAKPKPGYVFVKWMSGTKELGTNAKLEFILTQDTTITAYFAEKDPLVITVNVDPANAGTVTGAGNVKRGENATLTATPAAHYAFVAWKRLDNSTITTNPYTFKPLRDYTFTAQFRELDKYTLLVQQQGSGTVTHSGSVTGANTDGIYEEGETVTLTATAAEHYDFTEWQDADGNTLETEETYTFTIKGNVTVKAIFTEIDKYTVAVTRVPGASAGTVSGAGSYYDGDEVTLTASPAKGYKFVEWQKSANNEKVSEDNPYKFNITANVGFRAVFEALCEIKVTVDPAGAGVASGAGTYEQGDEVTLSTTVDDDYVFVAWTDVNGDALSTANPYTFTASTGMNITAQFREKEYFEIDVPCIGYADDDEDDLGTVSIPGDDHGSYKEGETFTMTATPNQYCRFVEWRDNKGNTLSTNQTYTFVISQDTLFQAVFTHIKYTVTLKSDPSTAYGTINGTTGSTSTGGTFNAGTTRRLEAKPRSGYEFVKWMSGEEELSTNPVLTFVLTKDITITAYFKEKPELTITVNVNPADAGTVTGAGQVTRGNDAILTATANDGFKFLYWERVDGTQHEDNPYTLVKPQRDYTFTAQFRAKEQYTITTATWLGGKQNSAAGTVTRDGFLANGKAEEDATITLTANANEGYQFVEWQDATGKQVGTDATFSFTATANATYRAVFEEILPTEYTITVNIEPAEGGRVLYDGTYHEGEEVTLKARPNRNYTFDGWYDAAGTTRLSADTAYKVTVLADVTYTAKFAKKPTVDVAVTVRLGETVDATVGTVTGAGEYAIGQTVTLTATPANADYVFSGWRDLDNDDELIGTANPFTFTASDNVHYAAVFREMFEVTLNILPDETAGEVKGAGFYREGRSVTLEATANEGYVFVAWLDENGQEVSIDRIYTITVSDNVTYTAKFVRIDEEHRHTITVRRLPNNEAGTVKGAGRYLHGAKDTLSATPAENYLFVAWLKQNADDATKYDTVSKRNPYVFTVEGDSVYTALFRTRARYTIEVDVLPNDNAGTVTGDGEYREGRAVTLEATPNAGYVFVAWVLKSDTPSSRDTVSRTPSYTFSASRNATYKAIFRRTSAKYTLTLNASPAAGGTVEGEGVFTANSIVTITAKPNSNYTFTGWRTGGKIVSKEPTYQFTITEDVTYTAVFARKGVITVTLNVTPENAGTVTGGGEYPMDAEALITATSNKGYRFVEWQDEAGQTLSTEANYTFTAKVNVIYTAVFEETDKAIYTVKTGILPSGSAAGTATGDGQYEEGSMATVTAFPNTGYVFKAWVDDKNEVLSTDDVYTFEVVADITCWALFESVPTITETVIIALKTLPDNAAGTVRGGGKYDKGAQVTIEAIPATNYRFVAWLNAAGERVTTNATYTFTAEADAVFSALFEPLVANEHELKAAFNVAAGNGQLFIDNLNAVTVKEVVVFNTVGRQLAHFTPNSNANLALPVDARYAVLVVRVISEQGLATYKVYLH